MTTRFMAAASTTRERMEPTVQSIAEQEELVEHMPYAELNVIHSDDGHDGFLLEQEQVAGNIVDFLDHHD